MSILSTLTAPPFVVPVDSFVTGHGDAAALQAAINAAQIQGQGGVILLSARTYTLTSTVVLPSGTRLLGSGAPSSAAAPPEIPGTVITGPVVLFRASSSPAGPADSLSFEAITFDGGVGNSGGGGGSAGAVDLIELFAVGDIRFERCLFQNAGGRYLYLWQAVGVAIVDCAFFGGGSTTLPSVAVQSGGAYGASQKISFRGCAFNDYAGTALGITGAGGQDFTLLNCAFKSLGSDLPALVLNDAAGIALSAVSFVSAGTRGHNLQAQLSIADSTGVLGALTVQHNPSRGAATYLLSFVSLSGGAGAIDLVLFDADSDPHTAPTLAKAVAATSSVHAVSIRTYAYSSTVTPAFSYAAFALPNQ
jgi:hypothetical protein